MAVPIRYNFRNLLVRKGTTAMTALGIALTVTTAIFIMALLAGLREAFATTGDPRNVLVLRKGSTSELSAGGVSREAAQVLKTLPGIATDHHGEPMVSGEDILLINLPRKDGSGEVNVTVRFLSPVGIAMRPRVKLLTGRWFAPGHREVTVSQSINNRFKHANIGDQITIGNGTWDVVGLFDAGGSAHESEIWGDVNQLGIDFQREIFSSVLIRATDPGAAQLLQSQVRDDQRLKLNPMSEPDYYASQSNSGAPIKFVGTIVAILMAIGSCFAAMNTMYAAVVNRAKEIAVLRVMGFSQASIMSSFVLESLLLSFLGALAGITLMLPFNGMSTGTSNSKTFSELVFNLRMTPGVVGVAMIFALSMGLLGGFGPAWHAARQNIVEGLRD
ncbi:MAG TPA: ABC transporter permease [Terriglobia bacterium]|nr:ABC transporter permease [Terriglobia bacterium]